MENKILVPVDFEQQSMLNLDWAKFYASFTNSQIILTHIIEENGFLKKLFKQEGFENKIKSEVKDKLKEISEKNFSDNEQFTITVEKGKPYEEIEDLAEEFNPSMVLLGRNEDASKSKKYLGSNTLHIINETDYPVVTIYGKNKPSDAQKTILLPLDLTKNFNEQITVALEYAKTYDAAIKAISVDFVDSIAHDSQQLVKMNKIKSFFEENNVNIVTEIIEAKKENIAQIINQQAELLNPMFVVVMLREETNFKRFFIGSVAREIIESCSAPVLSVQPWDKDNEVNPVFKTIVNPFNIV